MAVEMTVDFTDEQWELIKTYIVCHVPDFNADGEYLGTQSHTPTEELMVKKFKKDVQYKVNDTYRIHMLKTTGTDVEDIFPL